MTDIRAWRAGEHAETIVWAINPDGPDEIVAMCTSPEIASQIVAEHSLVTTPYADEEHQGGVLGRAAGALAGRIAELERRLGEVQP